MASFISEDNSISIAEKKKLMRLIRHLIKIETCDEDCNNLLDVIEDAKNDCNKLYRPSPGNSDFNYEKGAFIKNTACSELTKLQRKISDKTGGKSKKSKSKKNKSKKNKSKKNKSKKNKSRSKRRKTLRR
jgi:hypothetical protein